MAGNPASGVEALSEVPGEMVAVDLSDPADLLSAAIGALTGVLVLFSAIMAGTGSFGTGETGGGGGTWTSLGAVDGKRNCGEGDRQSQKVQRRPVPVA